MPNGLPNALAEPSCDGAQNVAISRGEYMNRTVEGLISNVCARYEHVNLKVLSGQRLCAVRFRKRTSAVIRGESPAIRK
jgi:hypothetical protein